MSFHKRFIAGGGNTSDATAAQWDIKSGKTAYIPAGKVTGTGYFPPMMLFDGSTGYYSKTYTSSGNKVTAVVRFNRASFSGGNTNTIYWATGPSAHRRIALRIFSSDHSGGANTQSKVDMLVLNSAGTTICRLLSSTTLADGGDHRAFCDFDGDAGTAVLRVDGVDEDDTGNGLRVAPTTGTLDSGASSVIGVGATSGGADFFNGNLGYFGMRDAGGLDWSDFMQTDGTPKPLDETTWAEWGAQPMSWHEAGKMDENLGSAGAMTKNGTITLASAIP